MDIQLSQQADFSIDINLSAGQLVVDDGLQTSVLISILTNALASDDDELPFESTEVTARQGWWGTDLLNLDTGTLGSKLWLNSREKITNQSIERIRENVTASLQWLLDDGIAELVDVLVERADTSEAQDISIEVKIKQPGGNEINFRFSEIWKGTFN